VGITVPVWIDDLQVQANRIVLNDLNASLVDQLRGNFPEATVLNENVQDWSWPKSDVVYADMNTFTLRKIDSWDFIFHRAADLDGWFILVDSCCYGFKFGKRASYLPYGPTEDHYWMALADALWSRYGLGIHFGCRADRASILATNHERSQKVEWLPPGDKKVELVYEGQLF